MTLKHVVFVKQKGESNDEIDRKRKGRLRAGSSRKRYGVYVFCKLYSVLLLGYSGSECDRDGNDPYGSAGI